MSQGCREEGQGDLGESPRRGGEPKGTAELVSRAKLGRRGGEKFWSVCRW